MGNKKITMQDIADSVGVSRITVWKALKNQKGVSENVRLQVREAAVQMGYASLGSGTASLSDAIGKTVSVIVSRPESSVFWTSIIHRVAKELAGVQINLLYTYLPFFYDEGYQFPQLLTDGTVSGAIILNVYDRQMLRMIDSLDIPKVYLDTVTAISPYDLLGDVFLLEGYESVKTITGSILDSGRTQLGFIGDVEYARTNSDRYAGFLAAFTERKLPVKQEYCLTGSLGVNDYYTRISSFLDKCKTMPQGFVCASDDVAYFLCQYLRRKGYRIPEDIVVSGYDGFPEHESKDFLTTVAVQTSQLGLRLANQLKYRVEYPQAAYELIYVQSPIRYGASTK